MKSLSLTLSDPMDLPGPTRLLHPWDSPGKSTEMLTVEKFWEYISVPEKGPLSMVKKTKNNKELLSGQTQMPKAPSSCCLAWPELTNESLRGSALLFPTQLSFVSPKLLFAREAAATGAFPPALSTPHWTTSALPGRQRGWYQRDIPEAGGPVVFLNPEYVTGSGILARVSEGFLGEPFHSVAAGEHLLSKDKMAKR